MAIIESLDADTETRRLSPVAIFGKLKIHILVKLCGNTT